MLINWVSNIYEFQEYLSPSLKSQKALRFDARAFAMLSGCASEALGSIYPT